MEKEENEKAEKQSLMFSQIVEELDKRKIEHGELNDSGYVMRVGDISVSMSWGHSGYYGSSKDWMECELWSGSKNHHRRMSVGKFSAVEFVDKIEGLIEIDNMEKRSEERRKNESEEFGNKMSKVFGDVKVDRYSKEVVIPLDEEEYGDRVCVKEGYDDKYSMKTRKNMTEDQLKRIVEILKEDN